MPREPDDDAGGPHPHFDLKLLTALDEAESSHQAEWRRVFNHFNPRLTSYFAGRVDDVDALDDLISEIWRRAMLNLHRLRSANALWSWMLQIGVNLLRDLGRQGVRHNGRRVRLESLTTEELDRLVVPRLSEQPDNPVDSETFREVLEELAPLDRELLELHVIDELTHADIAIRLDLKSAAASRKRLQRIRSQVLGRLLPGAGGGHSREDTVGGRTSDDAL